MDRNSTQTHSSRGLSRSLSARRAWIEIGTLFRSSAPSSRSLSARRAWIEMLIRSWAVRRSLGSLSARRAWIEMWVDYNLNRFCLVALRKESVDRNGSAPASSTRNTVALRKESVDRNVNTSSGRFLMIMVALRKESVDRNTHTTTTTNAVLPSLSARRAWIEIGSTQVDMQGGFVTSLSARRAWIEMSGFGRWSHSRVRRSPQGERG